MTITGEDLKRLRKISGMSQERLADMLGINASTVSRYETGKVGISKRLMSQLQHIFQIEQGNAITDTSKISDN